MKRPNLRSQGGQLIVEAILIVVLLFGVMTLVSGYFKNQELLKQLVTGPWQSLSGMLQNGVWGTPEKTAAQHPAGHFRHIAIVGETPQ